MTYGHCCLFVRGIHRSPVDSLHKGPERCSFDVSFVVYLYKLLKKKLLFETPWGLYDVTVMTWQPNVITISRCRFDIIYWGTTSIITVTSYGDSNQQLDFLFISILQLITKKTSKLLRITGTLWGNLSPVYFPPSQRTNNAESFSISWRNHEGPIREAILSWWVIPFCTKLRSILTLHQGRCPDRLRHICFVGQRWRQMTSTITGIRGQG